MLALTSSRAFNISLLHSAFGINLGCAISLPIFTRRRMHDMKLVIAEKPSVAQSIARVIGAASRKGGYSKSSSDNARKRHHQIDIVRVFDYIMYCSRTPQHS